MEPSSSKRIKVESRPTSSRQQLVGSNLLDDVASSDTSGSLSDIEDSGRNLNFRTLRWSQTFVDKSMLIRCSMKDKAGRVLLTAPPRFGKSMACDMLEMFFDIVNSEQKLEKYKLFKDLKIYKCTEECTDNHDCESKSFFRRHCGQHPVISLDFAQLSATSYIEFLDSLRDMLSRQFEKYKIDLIHKEDETYSWSNNNMGILDVNQFVNYLATADEDDYWIKAKNSNGPEQYIYRAFRYLIKVLSTHYQTKQRHKKIIVLIDEFDAPFMKLLFSENSDSGIIPFLRDLMRLLCKADVSKEFVERVMIFSVTAFSSTISLGANNVQRRTFLDKDCDYYKFFGFTKEEVEALVKRTVEESKQQEVLRDIAIWYNNYTVIGKDTTISNPVSITQYLSNRKLSSYWIKSVGAEYVNQLLKFEKMQEKVFPAVRENKIIDINTTTIELDNVSKKTLSESILNCITEEQVDFALQFLTERGYFNVIEKYNADKIWRIQIPNLELRTVFTDELRRALLKFKANMFDEKQQASIVNALQSLGCGKKHEPRQYDDFKKTVENLYTNRELPKAHFHFHSDLWTLISGSGSFHCSSELSIKEGWSPKLDLMIITECAAIIIEVKRNLFQDSAKKGLDQCLQKEYYKAFEHTKIEGKGLKKILMGIHLSDDRKVSIRYIEDFDERKLQNEEDRTPLIKTMVDTSYAC